MPGILMVVAAALVDDEGRVLVQQRTAGTSMAGLWEFPGGKVEPGESPEVALSRELTEELGIVVEAGQLAPIAFASEPLGERHLLLLLYILRLWKGTPQALQATALKWVLPPALHELEMPPADRPLIESLKAWV